MLETSGGHFVVDRQKLWNSFQLAEIAENKFKVLGKYNLHCENGSFGGTPRLMRQ